MDVSIDIETLSRSPRAIITEIGAVLFDRETGYVTSRHKTTVRVQGQLGLRDLDPETLAWWLDPERDQSSLRASLRGNARHLDRALADLRHWLKGPRGCGDGYELLWTNHPEFDVGILRDAYLRTLGPNEE